MSLQTNNEDLNSYNIYKQLKHNNKSRKSHEYSIEI